MKTKKYCYLEPEFPDEGFLALVLVVNKEEKKLLTPMKPLFGSTQEAINYVTAQEKAIKKIGYEILGTVLYGLKLKNKVPLIRDYWEKGEGKIGEVEASRAFMKFMKNPRLYQVLVVPREKGFVVAYPFYVSDDTKIVEDFMYLSKEVVDMRAKNAMMYTIETSFGVNWEDKKLRENKMVSSEMEVVN
ncbi:MAG: hypothetical protein WCV93_03015 [Candidatus Shapirobacteria bacterium]|jgi:hypothetical protein